MQYDLIKTDYKTSEQKIPFLYKLFPSFFFYSYVVDIVVRASNKAKKGKYSFGELCKSSYETIVALEKVGVSIDIKGMENLKNLNGPVVFVSNHMSVFETFVLPSLIINFRDAVFVVKKSLIDFPVFGHIMRALNPIVMGRENPREDLKVMIDEGTRHLEEGTSIIVFPQKTRIQSFIPEEFNTIGVKLAKKVGVPVVPIALKTDSWGIGKMIKDFGKINPAKKSYFEFGEPIPVEGRGNEAHEKSIEFIQSRIDRWFAAEKLDE